MKIKVAFGSGTDELNSALVERMRAVFPELPLWVVSNFPPEDKTLPWIPWYNSRTLAENMGRARASIGDNTIRLAGVMLVPNVPFRRMRLMALLLAPLHFLAFNENLNNFMLRPASLPAILRHCLWRTGNFVRALFAARPAAEVSAPAPAAPAVSVFIGRPAAARPRVLVASPYLPFPLSHGGAVRMYNLMLRAAREFDLILICFTDEIAAPPAELLAICAEVILVRREGTHELPSRGRPDTVEEFDSPAFHDALRGAVRKWQPAVAQLEFTQMAQYAADCAPARTLLIEHDVTLDLYQQMLTTATGGEAWEVRRQLALWRRFEHDAWQRVDRVVLMSEKDRRLVAVTGSRGEPVTLANGVDLERFRPSLREPEPRRVLFIGSFAHLPNLMALGFFLREVWPALAGATLHVISGARHEYYLDFYRDRVHPDLAQPGIEVEGFVSDVRPAYERAAAVVVPLVASAGTNIKVLEAMAMGKAVVSTAAGVNGLDLTAGEDFVLTSTGSEMAAAINRLFDDAAERRRLERSARRTAEREYGWDAIAARQAELYRECASSSSITTF